MARTIIPDISNKPSAIDREATIKGWRQEFLGRNPFTTMVIEPELNQVAVPD